MNVKEEYLRVYARIDLDALRKNMEHMCSGMLFSHLKNVN